MDYSDEYSDLEGIVETNSSLRDIYYDQLESMGLLQEVLKYNCTGVPLWQFDLRNVSFPGLKRNSSSSNSSTSSNSSEVLSELVPDTCEGCWSAENMVKLIAYLVMSLLSLGGNGMVIWMVISTARDARKVLNIYQANLAFIGIIVGTYCIWSHVLPSLNDVPRFLAPIFCRMNAYINATVLTAGTLTLAAIAFDSFRAIKNPFITRTEERKTWQWALILGLIWAISAVAALPFVIYSQEVTIQWSDYEEHVCVETWPISVRKDIVEGVIPLCSVENFWHQVYYTLFSVTIYFLPMFGMIIFYALMVKEVWCSRSSSLLASSEAFQSAPALARHHNTKIEVLKKSLVVMVAFLVCWTPMQCMALYEAWIRDPADGPVNPDFDVLEEAVYFFAYLSSVLNPLVYGGFAAALNAVGPKSKKILSNLTVSLMWRLLSKVQLFAGRNDVHPASGTNERQVIASPAGVAAVEQPEMTRHRLLVLKFKREIIAETVGDTSHRANCWV